ncbi:HAD family hydrolase [Actinopolymorpha rutila]|uniref:Putative hydrolase of the HAD superfamily n=1 Tax=Actinopolymorpha rutila TaxID=446787 RepID=A0A852ZLR2_9ACTN|nr:HAD family hydrolase [Actinopolymorpha rutila]NYH92818.1 putative hydrolase of the HAD superfamily [Actinopolymorpha rutila]
MAVIFFDGDQTLWDFRTLMRRTLAATIEELRRLVPAAEGDLSVDTFVADRELVAEQLRGTVTNLESIRLAAFTHSLHRLGIDDAGLAEHLNDYYLQRRFANVDLYDDVLPTLETLILNHSVGLLSNGNSYPARVGLEHLFSATVFSQDHGVEKPDPRIYAIARAAIPGDRYVMVGDSIPNDVIGAQQAGWEGIWLNRDRQEPPADARPDAILPNLHGLPALIGTG